MPTRKPTPAASPIMTNGRCSTSLMTDRVAPDALSPQRLAHEFSHIAGSAGRFAPRGSRKAAQPLIEVAHQIFDRGGLFGFG
jgi:hypothetical protein